MIILIDNYDSFTYNLVQYFGELGAATQVYRNDELSADEVMAQAPEAIVISPGPSTPDNAGICLELIDKVLKTSMPLLGICLGHQSIGQALGGKIVQTAPIHGKTDHITHINQGVFQGLPSPLEVTRYHSLIIEPQSLPESLNVTAQTSDGIIMGVAHKEKPMHGLQFHPESIATAHGHDMIKNFLEML